MAVLVAVVVVLGALGRSSRGIARPIDDARDDIGQEVELVVGGDGLLQVLGRDAFGACCLGDVGRFGNKTDHKELERLGCTQLVSKNEVALIVNFITQEKERGEERQRETKRTHSNRRDLGNLANLLICLHDALDTRDGELRLDLTGVTRAGGRRAGGSTTAVGFGRRLPPAAARHVDRARFGIYDWQWFQRCQRDGGDTG